MRMQLLLSALIVFLHSVSFASAFETACSRRRLSTIRSGVSAATLNRASGTGSSTILYSNPPAEDVEEWLQETMFPSARLEQRNAASRTDGYWPFVQQGEEPPQELTYGEFDLPFFAKLVAYALHLHERYHQRVGNSGNHYSSGEQRTFLDVGSGMGRLVWGAAALFPGAFSNCRGIEVLPSVHAQALQLYNDYQQEQQQNLATNNNNPKKIAPIQLECSSLTETSLDSDVIFCFSSCFGPELQQALSNQVGMTCRPGTVIITTEYQLPQINCATASQELVLIDQVDGDCWLTGGTSTAYVHQLALSS